jgi:hypothetical protein
MKGVFLLLLVPLVILNFLGGVIGGVWLAILGDWSTIFFGIAYMALGAIGLSVLLLPGIALAAPLAFMSERNIVGAIIIALPSLFWTFGVMAVSCAWAFSRSTSSHEGWLMPHFLWAYATAIAPWSYMASKEPQDSSAGVSVFFAQIGTISMMVAVWIDPTDTSMWRLLYWIAPFMLIGMALQLTMATLLELEQRRYGRLI